LRIKEKKGKYNQSGVYQLQCTDCSKKYIGQTRRTFETRFKEHMRGIRNNGQNSKFDQHILDTRHEYETIEKTIKILHIKKKGQMLDTYERFHIYEISKQDLQLYNNYMEICNPIYNTIISAY
jgi:hypothetical protein